MSLPAFSTELLEEKKHFIKNRNKKEETFCVILCISRIYQIAWFLHGANMWLGIDHRASLVAQW